MINIAIVEDDPAAVQRFTELIDLERDLRLVATASNLADARVMCATGGFDVLLCDLGLPDGDGVKLISEISRSAPEVDVLVVTVFANQGKILDCIRAGARGYILKDGRMEHFLENIRTLKSGGSPISPIIARQILKHLAPSALDADGSETVALSERESEVLNLLARGFSYEEIAGILGLSAQTISTYIKRLYRKLGVHSRSEAVFEGTSRGMIDVPR